LFSGRFRIALIASLSAACGGNTTPPKSVAHQARQRNGPPTWPKLSWGDRHELMTFTVLPNMAQTWQAFAKTDAPTLTCRTCHGENAEAARYQMPTPRLPPLDPAHMPSRDSSDANEARWTAFMTDEVVPQMIDLLDAPPSFGCFSCHTKKKSK
jgi:hypothetical protein